MYIYAHIFPKQVIITMRELYDINVQSRKARYTKHWEHKK